MGSRCLWRRVGLSLLLSNPRPKYRAGRFGSSRRDSAVATEAAPRSHESLQRTYLGAHASTRLVAAASRGAFLRRRFWHGNSPSKPPRLALKGPLTSGIPSPKKGYEPLLVVSTRATFFSVLLI